ncbi:bifunctional DNA-formamidopyrimidine glycosylase/DNA-(apurinic or apyrimidinic site) lyase [Patescibacteria group bacterium]|nr:bifunctional DNA-formamidopyrimidine glycosylase/DNA-(apurinic or apyrimidinic site) lyase [Patescibacteria group bacterium]
MPELPEVETVKRRLKEILPGKIIQSIEVLHKRSFGGKEKDLFGQEIQDVSRKAKLIRIHLPSKLNLLTHLKMTGQLIFINDDIRVGGGHPTADWVKDLPSSHTRLIYNFTDGSKLYFNDQRIFGWMRLMSDEQVAAEFTKYGPDINEDALTAEYLQKKFSNRRIPIKQAIMMNQIMAGLGNIYACDALNMAQISPFRPAQSLSFEELIKLLSVAKQVIQEGLEHGGTTYDGKYVHVDGMSGSYQDIMRVYGRENEKCRQCGGKIVKAKIGGRGTFYCESCQR